MSLTQNGVLKRDDNDSPVMGGTSSVDNATIINSAFNPSTRRLLVDLPSGSGTVTEVDTGTGLTGGPITTTGTISLDSKLAPLDTLGTALQSIRVNAGATALEYYTPAGGGNVTGPGSSTDTAIALYNGTGGTTIKNSVVLVSTGGNVTGVVDFTSTGFMSVSRAGVPATFSDTTNAANTTAFRIANSRTGAANDTVAFQINACDSAAAGVNIVQLLGVVTTATAGSVAGALRFNLRVAGTATDIAQLNPTTFTPTTNDGVALGTTALNWSDLFLATGGVINWANGNMTLTHSSGNLTVAGGTLTVPTNGLTINATNVTSTGTQLNYLNAAGGTTGTTSTNIVFSTSPTLVTPALGVATATSLAIGGATIGSNGLAVTGHLLLEGVTSTGATGTGALVFASTPTLVTPVLGVATATSINKVAFTAPASSATLTIADGKTLTVSQTMTLTSSGTSSVMTFPNATDTVGALGTIQTWTAQNKFNNIIDVNNAVTVTSNAGTVPVTFRLNTFTNSSAATMAITMATASAVDGQMTVVRIYDFSGVAQTIGWTNTENSTVSAPLTSNGSTTLPLTVGFMYNGATSKWRCIASA